jgi:hypothetical protein
MYTDPVSIIKASELIALYQWMLGIVHSHQKHRGFQEWQPTIQSVHICIVQATALQSSNQNIPETVHNNCSLNKQALPAAKLRLSPSQLWYIKNPPSMELESFLAWVSATLKNGVPVKRLQIIVNSSKANCQKWVAHKSILWKAEASLQPGASPDPSTSPINTHRSFPPPWFLHVRMCAKHSSGLTNTNSHSQAQEQAFLPMTRSQSHTPMMLTTNDGIRRICYQPWGSTCALPM